MKYDSGSAFRRALEDRRRTHSLHSGIPLLRLRKMVAFDRFLARLLQHQPEGWMLKGGLALQLRLGTETRTTKDVDMLMIAPGIRSHLFTTENPPTPQTAPPAAAHMGN